MPCLRLNGLITLVSVQRYGSDIIELDLASGASCSPFRPQCRELTRIMHDGEELGDG
jgi:hypothetical protein